MNKHTRNEGIISFVEWKTIANIVESLSLIFVLERVFRVKGKGKQISKVVRSTRPRQRPVVEGNHQQGLVIVRTHKDGHVRQIILRERERERENEKKTEK